MITVIIVTLAVAFLMMMLSTSYIDREVAKDVRQRTSGRRLLGEWVDKLGTPMSSSDLVVRLAGTEPDSAGWKELLGWGGLSDAELARLVRIARQQRRYERFLAELKPGVRNALVGAREGDAVFEYLATPERRKDFVEKVMPMGGFPTDRETLEGFVEEFTQTAPLRKQILAGHAAAVGRLAAELGSRPVLELLASADEGIEQMLRRHGFVPDPVDLAQLRDEAVLAMDAKRLTDLLRHKRMRGAIAKRVGADLPDLVPAHVFKVASSRKGAQWLINQIEQSRQELLELPEQERPEVIEPLTMSAERIAHVASERIETTRLSEIEAALPEPATGQWLGFSGRTAWLIIISFVVCAVGVTNAMLMSVTERFREIATMKCLGAMDSFIMIMFVMESSLQGLAGGVAGVVLGLLLGLTRSLWGFGVLAFLNLPGSILLATAGVCLLAGAALAALAAVYPAWKAARLAPMEAMRIE